MAKEDRSGRDRAHETLCHEKEGLPIDRERGEGGSPSILEKQGVLRLQDETK